MSTSVTVLLPITDALKTLTRIKRQAGKVFRGEPLRDPSHHGPPNNKEKWLSDRLVCQRKAESIAKLPLPKSMGTQTDMRIYYVGYDAHHLGPHL